MTKIKICGLITNKDINAVNLYQPDYAGFVFSNSKRKIDITIALGLIRLLDLRIKRVGVFVNENIDFVLSCAKRCKFNCIQLHGNENSEYINKLKMKLNDNHLNIEIWKAVRIKEIPVILPENSDAILFDTYKAGINGGTGQTFDWKLLDNLNSDKKIILSGGLNSENVLDAINTVKPDIVDVSSGVETDGHKDADKINAFIKAVRNNK
jgi:phosphoribosylanthranilate isomerase